MRDPVADHAEAGSMNSGPEDLEEELAKALLGEDIITPTGQRVLTGMHIDGDTTNDRGGGSGGGGGDVDGYKCTYADFKSKYP